MLDGWISTTSRSLVGEYHFLAGQSAYLGIGWSRSLKFQLECVEKEIGLRLLLCLVAVFSLVGTCSAQLPDYYKTVNRVTWVVENIDKVKAAWAAFGLSDIEEYPNIQLVGQFRGKPVTIYAWQITGHLGNLAVDMIQPAEGQANAYTTFLAKHSDGIFSIMHEVPSRQALEEEIQRMNGKGVRVLQQVTVQRGHTPVTYTYFDTEPE